MKSKLLAVVFGAVLVLGACGGDKAEKAPATDGATASVDAEAVVKSSCIACHGSNLEGKGNAPGLADIGARMSEDEIHTVIEKGQGGMPGGLIKGEDATAVAKWLAEKK
ncbi:cytochrome c551 [Sporosarcina sp. FSL K6-3457]|uniref:cytochrome c551 n=1 Tax=Sporosarcina sp. FSL K6-3457 TaxID=2978204 RepID=UPI0030F4E766